MVAVTIYPGAVRSGASNLVRSGLEKITHTDYIKTPAELDSALPRGPLTDHLVATGGTSVSSLAQAFQGKGSYPGVDQFVDVVVKKGTIVYAGEPGVSGFFTTADAALKVGVDATRLNEGLQIAPRQGMYRPGLTAYEVTVDTRAAYGIAKANTQFGAGGLPQLFIPNWQQVLTPQVSTLMENRQVIPLPQPRIPVETVAP